MVAIEFSTTASEKHYGDESSLHVRDARAALAASAAMAQDGVWVVRVRALNMNRQWQHAGGHGCKKKAVNDENLPEIDFDYQTSKNVPAELVLRLASAGGSEHVAFPELTD